MATMTTLKSKAQKNKQKVVKNMQIYQKISYNDINYTEYRDGGVESVLILHNLTSSANNKEINELVDSLVKQKISAIVVDLPYHGNDNSQGNFDYETALKKLQSFFWLPNLHRTQTHDMAIFAFGLSSIFALNCYKNLDSYNGTIFLYSPDMEWDNALLKLINKHGYKRKDIENNGVEINGERKINLDSKLFYTLKQNLIKEKIDTPNIYVFYPENETKSKIKTNEVYLKKCKNVTVKYLSSENPFDEIAEIMINHLESDYVTY